MGFSVFHISSKMTEVSEQNRAQFTHKWKATINRKIWTILHGKPQNFVNWPTEFGKFFHGKLWALLIRFENCLAGIFFYATEEEEDDENPIIAVYLINGSCCFESFN